MSSNNNILAKLMWDVNTPSIKTTNIQYKQVLCFIFCFIFFILHLCSLRGSTKLFVTVCFHVAGSLPGRSAKFSCPPPHPPTPPLSWDLRTLSESELCKNINRDGDTGGRGPRNQGDDGANWETPGIESFNSRAKDEAETLLLLLLITVTRHERIF